jgi:hypothetical protein
MREKDRELRRRRNRRIKRLKKRVLEESAPKPERPTASKRAVKKPPVPAEGLAEPAPPAAEPAEKPEKAEKKKPAAKKAPAPKKTEPEPGGEGEPGGEAGA